MLKAAIIVVDDLAVNTDLPQGIINTAMNKVEKIAELSTDQVSTGGSPCELPVGDGLVRDGLNQARVIIPDAGLIDPFRDRPHA